MNAVPPLSNSTASMRMSPVRIVRWALTVGVALLFAYNLWLRIEVYDIDDHATNGRIHTEGVVIGDYTDLVNVFIGTTNLGHVFPGATLPHGMVKAGMDTDSPDNHAGYDANPKYHATGFSQLHDDGTGGGIPLSNFKLWPLKECTDFSNCPVNVYYRQALRSLNPDGTPDDEGHPGYFSTNLSTGIRVELTATRRTALHRYTFPPVPDYPTTDFRPRIIVDMNDGQRSASNAEMNVDPLTGRMMGGASFIASFGNGHYFAFVCVDFKGENYDIGEPAQYGVYQQNKVHQNATELLNRYGQQGSILTFAPNKNKQSVILARVGVSMHSAEQACMNAEEEIPDFNFESVRNDADLQWNELLGRFQIQVDERDMDTAVLFYSSLYRTHIVPSDFSEENPSWLSDEPYYDGLYCNWDTYRTLFPLMSIHDPITFSKVVRSFIDVQQHEGWLPECRDAAMQEWVQGGSNGDPIVAEFFVKFDKQAKSLGVSAEDLYTALLQDAEVESPNWDLAGRQANVWKELGYLPSDGGYPRGGMNTRQVSRSLEYAFDDFTIAQVAKILNKTNDWLKYTNRSRNFELVWNPNTTIEGGEGIVGFMQPRFADGRFTYTDPRHCTVHDPRHSTCYLSGANHDGFYEGGPIVYSQYVPHDTARLIELQGGYEAFIRRLDFIFDNDYFDCTNEPSQQIPFMYHYANRPGLSTERARQTITRFFNTTPEGLPGNDDSGAMGSYVAFYLLGLYPLPATRQFLISSPHFSHIKIWNPLFETWTTINAHGFEGNPPDGIGGNIYVSGVKINGKPWKSICYIEWDVFEQGATVDLELSSNRTLPCGADSDALPPSLSTGGYDL